MLELSRPSAAGPFAETLGSGQDLKLERAFGAVVVLILWVNRVQLGRGRLRER